MLMSVLVLGGDVCFENAEAGVQKKHPKNLEVFLLSNVGLPKQIVIFKARMMIENLVD